MFLQTIQLQINYTYQLYLSKDSDVISDQHFLKLCMKVVAHCPVCKQAAEDRARHKAYLASLTVPLRISTVTEADKLMIKFYTVHNNNLVQTYPVISTD